MAFMMIDSAVNKERDTSDRLAELVERATDDVQAGRSSPESCELTPRAEPDEAESLVSLVAWLHELGVVSEEPESGEGGLASSVAGSSPSLLDDFRILREIGRGGMGVVYEAEQLSLGRRVALKILPFPSVLDSRQVRRFKHEVRATAAMDHPNIVPVYAVGCAGHVHYYAMRLIRGESLADFVSRLRLSPEPFARPAGKGPAGKGPAEKGQSDTFSGGTPWPASPFSHAGRRESQRLAAYYRLVARMGIQAAEALQHAHECGIVHRDVKPSNLLLDQTGRIWITDFGLARTRDDVSLTASGDVVGTLRYMAPEQTRANPLTVDHRVDVYSLGVTIYELLTLQPAFGATNRQCLLRQIVQHDTAPPRRINRAIPGDLQVIVLKAMAERPEDRYATAGELAEDLRRFVSGQPIVARPPTLIDRAARWTRRHTALVGTTVISLLLLAVALSAGILLIAGERSVAQSEAHRARQMARVAAQQKQEAEENFRQARQAVERMVYTATNELAELPGSGNIRHSLLHDALEFYEDFVNQEPADDAVRCDLAEALLRLGEIHHQLGNDRESSESLNRCRTLLEQLLVRDPANQRCQAKLADALQRLAHTMLERQGCCPTAQRLASARTYSDRRLELLRRLSDRASEDAGYRVQLADALVNSGLVWQAMGEPRHAASDFREALETWSQIRTRFPWQASNDLGHAAAHHALGQFLLQSEEDGEEASVHLEAALQLQLEGVNRDGADARHDLARIRQDLATLLARNGRLPQAQVHLDEALGLCEQLLADFPQAVHYAERLASCQFDRYRLLALRDEHQAASDALRQSTASWEQLAGCSVSSIRFQLPLARNYETLGLRALRDSQPEVADRWFRCSLKVLETCRSLFPHSGTVDAQTAWLLATCPVSDFRNPARALQLARRAVECEPQDPSHWTVQAAALYRTGNWTGAAGALDKADRIDPGSNAARQWLRAMTCARLKNWENARRARSEAIRLEQQDGWSRDRVAYLRREAEHLVDLAPPPDSAAAPRNRETPYPG